MTYQRRLSLARTVATVTACLALAGIFFLVVDYAQVRYSEPIEKEQFEAMEEAVRTDASVAAELTAERERQTLRALERDERNRKIRIALIVVSAAFLVSANWWLTLKGRFNVLNWGRGPRISPSAGTQEAAKVPREYSKVSVGSSEQLVTLQVEPDIDLSFVEQTVATEGQSREAAIPILRAIQVHYGYLPDEALRRVCELTEITPAQIAGTSTFYAQFRRSPVGKHIVKICHGTACHVSGIVQIDEELRRHLQIAGDADTDPARLFTLEKVACLGCCSLAPVIMIGEHTVGRLTPSSACGVLDSIEKERVT